MIFLKPAAENTEDGTLKSFQPQFLSTVQSQVSHHHEIVSLSIDYADSHYAISTGR